jgi:hypothetical protein
MQYAFGAIKITHVKYHGHATEKQSDPGENAKHVTSKLIF